MSDAEVDELMSAMARVVRGVANMYPKFSPEAKQAFRRALHEAGPHPHFVPAHIMQALDNICAAYREIDEQENDGGFDDPLEHHGT